MTTNKQPPEGKQAPSAGAVGSVKPSSVAGYRLLAWTVLALGIALSAAAAYLSASQMEREARLQFDDATGHAHRAIQARIQAYYDILFGIRALFIASDYVTRGEFRDYIDSLDLARRHPGLQVIHYGQRIAAGQKQPFEAMVRNDTSVDPRGYPEFMIKPPGDRPEYVIVLYVEPMAANEAALGLDLTADAVRLAALERARDSGRITASGIIALALDPRKYPGFAMRLPVYGKGMPLDTVAQRREAFIGMVSASFHMRDLMRGILNDTFVQKIHVRINDAGYLDRPGESSPPAAASLMFDSDHLFESPSRQGTTGRAGKSGLSHASTLEVGGRQWNLNFSARDGFLSPFRQLLPWVAMLVGIIISVLLFGLIRSLAASGSRAVKLAGIITEDLRRSEASLAEAQRMTQQLIESLPNPIFFKGTDGRYLGVNRAWEKFFGVARNTFIGKTVHDLYPNNPEIAAHLHAMDQELWNRPGSQTYETSITTPGGRHDAIYCKATFTRADGGLAGLIGTIIDITERKELERRFRETFDQAAVGIVHTSLDGNYLQVNQKFCEMLGYREAELVGRAAANFAHPEDRDKSRQARQLMWEGKLDKFTEERRYLRKDGSVLWSNRTVSLARDASGAPLYFIRVIEDITGRKEIEERYRATFDNAPVGIMHTTVDGYRILSANRKLSEMLGYTQEELLGMTSTDVVHPDYRFSDRSKYNKPILSDELPSFTSERKFIRKDGSSLWVNRTVSLVRDAAGEPLYFIRIIEDITERKQTENRQAMEHAVTRVLADAATLSEAIFKIIQTVCQMMGWHYGARWHWDEGAGVLRCVECWGLDTPEIQEFMRTSVNSTLKPGPIEEGLVRRTFILGKPVWMADVTRSQNAMTRAPMVARAGLHGAFAFPLLLGSEVLGVMEFFHHDVREPEVMLIQTAQSIGNQIGQYIVRQQAEEAVKQAATRDALTGLPNRAMFNQRLGHAIDQAKRHTYRLAVMFIDLDRFKFINDTLGHEAGDELLRKVATRFNENLRTADTAARLGGDEFVVLIEQAPDPHYVGNLAQKLIALLNTGFMLSEREYHISASIGISTYPDDGDEPQTLLKNADIAMYRAKEEGRNRYRFFSAQMNVHSIERLTLESNLRRALQRNELVLHYQPKLNISSGRITGMEALVRWQQSPGELMMPMQFIPLAEETGLIAPIGEWVLRTACARSRLWQEQGLPPLRVAVNLSARQFDYENLVQDVARVLRETRLDPTLLEFEITESMVMRDPEHAVSVLTKLKAMGIRISIDDFGTGYSSLAYLKRFPIDSVKIDRSFIQDLPRNEDDSAIALAIIAMAHSLRLRVIAEGVETDEQLAFLRTHGCDEMQGYHFSRPLPADDFSNLVRGQPAADHDIA